MGCNFCRKKGYQKINYLAPNEKEIEIKDYSSENDKLLEIIETKQNFFQFVQLVEYVNLLEQFNIETATVVTDEPMRTQFKYSDKFLSETINEEEFQSFIENKIFNLEELSELIGNNQEAASLFKQICLELYKSLKLKLNQHYNNDSIDSNDSIDIIKKQNLLAIGILFCACENIEKIKLIFDIFKNESNEFCKSENLNDFLLTLFLISSYCLISARNKISNTKLGIGQIEKEDLLKLIKVSELKDNENLVKIFNDSFFKQEKYRWDQFKNKFQDIDNGFGWVLSSKGIRRKLEENNI